jgi:hypothetical protein
MTAREAITRIGKNISAPRFGSKTCTSFGMRATRPHAKYHLRMRSRYNDAWNQKLDTKWVRARGVDGDGDDSEAVDPRSGDLASGPAASGGEVEISNPNRVAVPAIRRHVAPPLPDIATRDPWTKRAPRAAQPPRKWSHVIGPAEYDPDANHERVATIPEDYGRRRRKSGFPDLELDTPKLMSVGWHREAGYLRFSDDKDPKTWWGLPGSSTGDDSAEFGRFRDPWWRGEDLVSPAVLKVPVPAELICERDAPSRPAQTTAAWCASKPRHTRRAAIMVRLRPHVKSQPAVAAAQPPFGPAP